MCYYYYCYYYYYYHRHHYKNYHSCKAHYFLVSMQQNRKMKSENVRKNGSALCMFDHYLSWLGTIGELLGKWGNQKHRKIDNWFPDHDFSIGCITSHQQTVDLPRETWHGVLTIVDLTTTGLLIYTSAWICLSYLKLSLLSKKPLRSEWRNWRRRRLMKRNKRGSHKKLPVQKTKKNEKNGSSSKPFFTHMCGGWGWWQWRGQNLGPRSWALNGRRGNSDSQWTEM